MRTLIITVQDQDENSFDDSQYLLNYLVLVKAQAVEYHCYLHLKRLPAFASVASQFQTNTENENMVSLNFVTKFLWIPERPSKEEKTYHTKAVNRT